MIKFRKANLNDVKEIQQIERGYYEGYNCPENVLKFWIKNLPENFILAEEENKIIGFIFFEYLNDIKTIPFVHKLEHKQNGKYAYISEIGISDEFIDSDVPTQLFDKVSERCKNDGIKMIIWLTGSKTKHDKIEKSILINNGFEKKERIKHWEAYPKFFVNDHYIWIKRLL